MPSKRKSREYKKPKVRAPTPEPEEKPKADITISIKPDRSGVNMEYSKKDVVKFEPVTDEEPIDVKQPASDPNKDPITIEPLAEPIPVPHEESTVEIEMVTLVVEEKLIETIAKLPAPIMTPTNRQYGEDFLPEYIRVRAKLRRLAGLSST